MGPRGHTRLALVLVVCAAVVAGVVAAIVLMTGGDNSKSTTATTTTNTAGAAIAPTITSSSPAPTTGSWAPITVKRPKLPVIAGGIPVDIDPLLRRTTDFGTTMFTLPPDHGRYGYRMTILNTSNLGAINSLQWYPPTGVRILKILESSAGECALTGLKGFGGSQFPTLVLYPNILCTKLDLKPPTCTCLGDGGDLTISFLTDKYVAAGEGDLRMRAATLTFDPVPSILNPRVRARHVTPITASDSAAGGDSLTGPDRVAAQTALDNLQDSNISLQLLTTTQWLQAVPSMCRIHLVSRNPDTFSAFVFWSPWLAASPFVWLNMTLTNDLRTSTFRLGTAQPVLPGGRLKPDGRSINRRSVDTTLLSRYGAEGVRIGHRLLTAHAGDVFKQPSAPCQLLKNGSLKLLPS